MGPATRAALAWAAAAVLLGGCGGATTDAEITVFAASSLTDAFEEVGAAFEAAHPGTSVAFSFAGSSTLREQILSGAPADVFASANPSNMRQVVAGGEATAPTTFARNRLQIVVPTGNPADISGLDDFADGDLLIGLCAEEVPCGQLGRQALARAGVRPAVDTNEADVRSLLTKVAAGDLDAGLVYVTDVRSAGDAVEGVDVPAEENVIADYPIAVLTGSAHVEVAGAFVAFVRSARGQRILAAHGFEAP